MRAERGFTLMEALTVLVIGTILVTLAVPSFTTLTEKNTLSAASSSIKTDLLFARNQSVSYLNYVTVCPLENNSCSDNWGDGLDIFIDTGTRGTFDSDDVLLKSGNAFNSNDTLLYPDDLITFTPDGQITGTSQTFRYCSGDDRIGISVAYSGRAKITDSDSITACN